jgi:hypothetical protein
MGAGALIGTAGSFAPLNACGVAPRRPAKVRCGPPPAEIIEGHSMRIVAVLGFLMLVLSTGHARAQAACDTMSGSVVQATGTVSDFIYKQSDDQTQFFIRETNLACRADIWVFVAGRVFCRDGKRAMVEGRFDTGDIGVGKVAYVIMTDSDHVACK